MEFDKTLKVGLLLVQPEPSMSEVIPADSTITAMMMALKYSIRPKPKGCFQRRGNSQTDGFLRPRNISHDEIGGQRVKPPVHTLH